MSRLEKGGGLGYPTVLMKRTLAALVLIVGLLPRPARPQSSIISQVAGDAVATEKLHFSLLFGLNVAYLTGAEEIGRTGGFIMGLSATIGLAERLSVAPEITLFSRKGLSGIPFVPTGDPALDPFFADPAQADLALTYVDVPVVVTYRFGRFHLGAGPYLGLLGAAAEKFRAELDSGEELRFSRDVAERYRSADFGLVAEASWTVAKPRRGMGLVFHVRYQAGLAGVLREPGDGGSLRNSVIQAFVSFPFVH
jgi:Outer membrane protein beta-barrel domain